MSSEAKESHCWTAGLRCSLFCLILIPILAACLQCSAGNSPVKIWHFSGWGYRTSITVDNSHNTNRLSNYQVRLVLNKTNFDFSATRSNGEDIRIAGCDDVSALHYWIEYWDNAAESAVVWVKIPVIRDRGKTSLYLYHGNPQAGYMGDSSQTFEFVDTFDRIYTGKTGWTTRNPIPVRTADVAAAVWNNQLYLFGGYDRDSAGSCGMIILNKTYAYDPLTDTWIRKADMPTARWGAVAVEFNGLIHVFAGSSGTGQEEAHEIYDPANDTWTIAPNVQGGLAGQGGMGVRYKNKIYLFFHNANTEYDPVRDKYIPRANIPTIRKWGVCGLVQDKIYIIGGASATTPGGATDANECYDPNSDSWTTKSPAPIVRYGTTIENPVIDGKIYVTHGHNAGFFASNYAYDPLNDSWERKSSAQFPRDGVGCGVINGKLYVAGGRDKVNCPVGRGYLEEYDPLADQGGGADPWIISDNVSITRDPLARYSGEYGLLFDLSANKGEQFAEYLDNFGSCAIDILWNISDYWGLDIKQPQGSIAFTETQSDGSLYFFNDAGTPKFEWFNGSFQILENGNWNRWYPLTIFWNGAFSRAVINGDSINVTANGSICDRVTLRAFGRTRQFFDMLRVRKYSNPEPEVIVGATETKN